MKMVSRTFALATAGCVLVMAPRSPAQMIVMVEQVAGDVVVSGGGTLDITMFTFFGFGEWNDPYLQANFGLLLGPIPGFNSHLVAPASFNGPESIGPGIQRLIGTRATAGDSVGLIWDVNQLVLLVVPTFYVSGEPINAATVTYEGHTFESLGLTPATYTWTWDTASGGVESFTIQVVPAPSTLALLSAAMFASRRHRSRRP